MDKVRRLTLPLAFVNQEVPVTVLRGALEEIEAARAAHLVHFAEYGETDFLIGRMVHAYLARQPVNCILAAAENPNEVEPDQNSANPDAVQRTPLAT